ncbi:hypothetical protein [Actinomadura coerulea]|uniref:hypothetical protein n=1 Tax=Actinomadura coerulea TaxID=46159 RepID=UPI00342E074A
MRGFLNMLLQISAIGFILLVLNQVGFEVIWNAATGLFTSWGAFFAYVAVVAGLTGLVFTWTRKS